MSSTISISVTKMDFHRMGVEDEGLIEPVTEMIAWRIRIMIKWQK